MRLFLSYSPSRWISEGPHFRPEPALHNRPSESVWASRRRPLAEAERGKISEAREWGTWGGEGKNNNN